MTSSNGKQLEGLVAFVEKTLLPQGFEVKTNEHIFNDEGIQIAEFDIEIRGKMGTTQIAWLIECRDRPSQGGAPGSWIEQLVGRRIRFGFNKITAVSTTGFASGARKFAQEQGIELREVSELSVDAFSDWFSLQYLTRYERLHKLNHALILVSKNETKEKKAALKKILSNTSGDASFLKSSRTGETISAASAFMAAVNQQDFLFDGLEANGLSRQVKIHAQYINENDHFLVETDAGLVSIEEIRFEGELSIREYPVPLSLTAEYRQSNSGEVISQLASFTPQQILGLNLALEMHRMSETGETHVILRCVDNKTK